MSDDNAMRPLTNEMLTGVSETYFFASPEVQQSYPRTAFFMIWAYALPQDKRGSPTHRVADMQARYDASREITFAETSG